MAVRTRLSVSHCRTKRPVVAPMASRTAVSSRRADARASNRPPTLAQIMNSSSPTPLISRIRPDANLGRISETPLAMGCSSRRSSASHAVPIGFHGGVHNAGSFGLSASQTHARTQTRSQRVFKFAKRVGVRIGSGHQTAAIKGTKISGDVSASMPLNRCGITPTTVNGRSSSVMVLPTIAGSR